MGQSTLVIIKPDAVAAGHEGAIREMIGATGLRPLWGRWYAHTINRVQVESLYREHLGKPYYEDLCSFMTSGPVSLAIIYGTESIRRMRELAGTTDPSKAADGTIRSLFGTAVNRNAVHSSDSPHSAEREICIFFSADALS